MKETTKGFDVILVGQKHAQTYIIHNILERKRERGEREMRYMYVCMCECVLYVYEEKER